MHPHLLLQYCQKLVVLSADKQSILLAKRKGEADYNGVYSFIGGKMEEIDKSLLAGMKREKDEEIGPGTRLKLLPNESYNVLITKKDGNRVVLPHIAAIFCSGEIVLSDEYSEYKWVPVTRLSHFEPKIENITEITLWSVEKLSKIDEGQLVEI